MYDAFPWFMHRFPGPHQQVFAYNDFMHSLVMNEVQSHKEKWKADNPQDLIDFYLAHIAKVSACILYLTSFSLASLHTANFTEGQNEML